MPLYEYACEECNTSEDRLVAIVNRDNQACSICSNDLKRKLVFEGAVYAPTSTSGGLKV